MYTILIRISIVVALLEYTPTRKMDGGENSDSDQFSDDEFYNDLPDDDFDLLQLNEEEREQLAGAIDAEIHRNDSEEELDDENLPLFYSRPRFDWTSGNYVAPVCDR